MGIYTNFPSGWWPVLGIICGIYLIAYISRKNKKPNEVWPQIKIGMVTVILGFLIEFVGVSLKIWTYFPGNWPVILWIGYFGVGLAGYQVSKKLEEH